MRRLISSGSSFETAIGYSRAAVDGEWVFVSGTTGFDYATMTISDDVGEQVEQALANVETALQEAGSGISDVVRVRYVLPLASDFEACWPALRRRFGDVRPAATMIVAGLADARMKFEMEVTARISAERDQAVRGQSEAENSRMNASHLAPGDPELDLVLERVVDVPVAKVWAAWTEPERLKRWFTPEPWATAECEIDLRPGGAFKTVMRSPEGQLFPNVGCYLVVEPERRLVFTGVLGAGFRPVLVPPGMPAFTAIVDMAPEGSGTRYKATAMHPDAASRAAHEAMGFQTGWGKALDQLVALCKAGDG